MAVSQQLLDVLACPKCKRDIRYEEKENAIFCDACKLKFKVLEGDIPDMLLEHAEKI